MKQNIKINHPFSIKKRIESIMFAVNGIFLLIKTQHNAWIHIAASTSVIILGIFVGIQRAEWFALIITICLVWLAESLNTAIEFLCDFVSPEFNHMIEKSKDIAAGAVLITALVAVVMGVLIFYPYL